MKLTVRLFAAARQLADAPSLDVELEPDTNVAALRRALVARCPALEPLVSHAMIAVNTEYAAEDAPLSADDEIALIPPVSGG